MGLFNDHNDSIEIKQKKLKSFIAQEDDLVQKAQNGETWTIGLLAEGYLAVGETAEAYRWAEEGLANNDGSCLRVMGLLALQNGDYNAAENYFAKNVRANDDVDSAVQLGYMYLRVENIAQATRYFKIALRGDSSHPEAAFGLASCISNDKDSDLDQIEYLIRIATQSDDFEIREAAKKLLQQIHEVKAENARQQNNCFITTAVCNSFDKPDDCFELTTFRNFRDTWLVNQPDGKALIAEYYDIAPRIVANINRLADAAQIYKSIWQQYLEPCLNFIRSGDNLSCKNKYVEMVRELKKYA